VERKLNGTNQALAYDDDDDVNLLGDDIEIVRKSTETVLDASKKVGLEVHREKTKYTL
jgi:hypothetical protein